LRLRLTLARVWALQGRSEEAEAHLRRCRSDAINVVDVLSIHHADELAAWLLTQKGQLTEALSLYRERHRAESCLLTVTQRVFTRIPTNVVKPFSLDDSDGGRPFAFFGNVDSLLRFASLLWQQLHAPQDAVSAAAAAAKSAAAAGSGLCSI
jgi:hypothetical protein